MKSVLLALLGVAWLGAAYQADPLAQAARKVKQIVAHRGSSADCPENTLAAYRRAMAAGATAVEVDVRTTKDGVLISLHDADVKRTTNGQGLAATLTLAELQELDAGSWFDKKFKGERIPTLKSILELCRDRVDVLLDLQESGEDYVGRVVGEVRKHGQPKRIIVGARSLEQAKLFRKLLPEARQLGLIPKPDSIEAFAEAGVETIRLWPKWLTDEKLVARVRKTGKQLHLNGTTGAEEEVRMLLEYHPESMSSDDPGRLRETLAKIAATK